MFRATVVGILFSVSIYSFSHAATYEYHPGSVLKLGGTFDPKNLTVSFPSCIRYQREYAIHRLNRKQEAETPIPSKNMEKGLKPGEQPKPLPKKEYTVVEAVEAKEEPKEPLKAPAEKEGSDVPANIAADSDLSIQQIKTREHLYKFLNISTSISGQYKFFSANASMTYESEETFDADSFVFGVRGMTTFAELGLIDPRLSDDARKLASNRLAFYARCGREWVSQETRGVLIAVVYTVKNVSQSQRSRLEAAISGGFASPVLKINVEGKLKQIFESAFLSNYYSTKVHAIGGGGVKDFAETVNNISDPAEVLKKISDYMKNLTYESSVPLSFTTGSLDQFLAEERAELLFDTYNRRIGDLFLAYEEYRNQRSRLWSFVNDDTQSVWDKSINDSAWARISILDDTLGWIETKAQVCRKAGDIAAEFSTSGGATRNNSPIPADRNKSEFVRDFSIGISSLLVKKPVTEYSETLFLKRTPRDIVDCQPKGKTEVEIARGLLCECVKRDDAIYVKDRFNLSSTPSVNVIYDTDILKPKSLLYVSVSSVAKLETVRLLSNDGQVVLSLKGGVDPNSGPIWYGSVVFRDGNGSPPPAEKLPYVVEMKDQYGRVFTKPIVPLN